jgi:hypothetical protein
VSERYRRWVWLERLPQIRSHFPLPRYVCDAEHCDAVRCAMLQELQSAQVAGRPVVGCFCLLACPSSDVQKQGRLLSTGQRAPTLPATLSRRARHPATTRIPGHSPPAYIATALAHSLPHTASLEPRLCYCFTLSSSLSLPKTSCRAPRLTVAALPLGESPGSSHHRFPPTIDINNTLLSEPETRGHPAIPHRAETTSRDTR